MSIPVGGSQRGGQKSGCAERYETQGTGQAIEREVAVEGLPPTGWSEQQVHAVARMVENLQKR